MALVVALIRQNGLELAVALTGVGVWAATQQSFAVSSKVGFTATGIEGSITMYGAAQTAAEGTGTASSATYTLSGALVQANNKAEATAVPASTAPADIDTFTLADTLAVSVSLDITLGDSNDDGTLATTEGYKVTFTFTNSSTITPYYVYVTYANDDANNTKLTVSSDADTTENAKTVAASGTATVTLTYTVAENEVATIDSVLNNAKTATFNMVKTNPNS